MYNMKYIYINMLNLNMIRIRLITLLLQSILFTKEMKRELSL